MKHASKGKSSKKGKIIKKGNNGDSSKKKKIASIKKEGETTITINNKKIKAKIEVSKKKYKEEKKSDSISHDDMDVENKTNKNNQRQSETDNASITTGTSPKILKTLVHRIKYNIQSSPASILKLSCSPKMKGKKNVETNNNQQQLLSISRSDGSVELIVLPHFHSIGFIPGIANATTFDSLVCCSVNSTSSSFKFFAASSQQETFCSLNFTSMRYDHVQGSGGGSIFCMESNDESASSSCLLACGCEDGCIRIWDVTQSIENEQLLPTLKWGLPKAGNAILSLCWKKIKNVVDDLTIFAGVGDGTIRRYDYCGSKSWNNTWRITIDTLGSQTPTRIWALKSLPSSDSSPSSYIVSGNSIGQIQFWNDETGLLDSVFSTKATDEQHGVAIFDIASYQENKIFATGIDSKILCIEKVVKRGSINDHDWVGTNAYRNHTHDVKTLCLCNDHLLLSGGVDTKIFSFDPSHLNKTSHCELMSSSNSYFETLASVTLSKQKRLLAYFVSNNNTNDSISKTIEFLKISNSLLPPSPNGNRNITNDEEEEPAIQKIQSFKKNNNPIKLKSTIGLSQNNTFNYNNCVLSHEGDIIVASNTLHLLFFWLLPKEDVDNGEFHSIPIISNEKELQLLQCSAIQFLSPQVNESEQRKVDSNMRTLICITTNNILYAIQISLPNKKSDTINYKEINQAYVQENLSIKIAQMFDLKTIYDSNSLSYLPIQILSISTDNEWLATLQHAISPNEPNIILSSSVQIFKIEKNTNLQHWWTIPSPNHNIIPTGIQTCKGSIIIIYSNHKVYMHYLQQKQLSDWNVDATTPDSDKYLPEDIRKLKYYLPIQIIPYDINKCIMRSYDLFYMVDFDLPIPKGSDSEVRGRANTRNFIICERYRGLLFMDFLSHKDTENCSRNELLLVELPRNDILNVLSDPLERKEYAS